MAIVLTKGLRMVEMTEDTRSWKGVLGSVSWGPAAQPHQVKQCPVHATGSVAGGAKGRTRRLLLRFNVQTKFQLPPGLSTYFLFWTLDPDPTVQDCIDGFGCHLPVDSDWCEVSENLSGFKIFPCVNCS